MSMCPICTNDVTYGRCEYMRDEYIQIEPDYCEFCGWSAALSYDLYDFLRACWERQFSWEEYEWKDYDLLGRER